MLKKARSEYWKVAHYRNIDVAGSTDLIFNDQMESPKT